MRAGALHTPGGVPAIKAWLENSATYGQQQDFTDHRQVMTAC
jgi:hypothetical protein